MTIAANTTFASAPLRCLVLAGMALCIVLGTATMSAAEPTVGVQLLETNDTPAHYDTLYANYDAIVSPDGKHLYMHRFLDEDLDEDHDVMISVLGLAPEGNHRPSLIKTYGYSCCDDGALAGPNLIIEAFNPEGTRAYARFHRPPVTSGGTVKSGLVVLERNPSTGDLTQIQRINLPDDMRIGVPVVTVDGASLYVSIAPARTANAEELRVYNIQPLTGFLGAPSSLSVSPEDSVVELTLIDNDSGLIASTTQALIEYRRDVDTGALTRVRKTLLPELSVDPAKFDLPGPVSLAAAADGRWLYTLRRGNGGFLNTFSRDPVNGELTLVDQLFTEDFPDNAGYFSGLNLLFTHSEDILLATTYFARYFSSGGTVASCLNALARDTTTGLLRTAGTQCSYEHMGHTWARHPNKDLFYTNASALRSVFFGLNDTTPSRLAVWGVGRIPEPTNIHAAILPTSRSVGDRTANHESATYFTTVINPGNEDALQCRIGYGGDLPISVFFQINDPATNEPLESGRFDRLFDVPAGGFQNLTLTVVDNSAFATSNIELSYRCVNALGAPLVQGVSTMLMSASDLPLPDLITATATISNDGITTLPSRNGTGAFAASTINIGAEDEIRAVPVFDLADLVDGLVAGAQPAQGTLRICETNPSTGQCLASPTAEVARLVSAGEIATFTVFVIGNGSEVALDPARNRVFIAFVDSMGEVRGASSVAIVTAP